MKNKILFFVILSFLFTACATTLKQNRKYDSVNSVSFSVINNQYTLNGQINEIEGAKTIAIFLHGSGVHDRWETLPADTTLTKLPEPFFKPISDELNKKGIATCVFDKRGFAEKGKPEYDAVIKTFSFENIKSDAKAVVAYIIGLNKYEHIVLVGHSEGTVTASEIVFDLKEEKKISGLVLVGVLAENLKTSLYNQLTEIMAANVFAAADKNHDGKIYEEEIPPQLKAGLPLSQIDKDKKGYIVKSDLLNVLKIQADSLMKAVADAPAEAIIMGKPALWYRDLFNRRTLFDRADEYYAPVLIAHGELDQNVLFSANAKLLNEKLVTNGKRVVLKSFPYYGHALSPEKDGLPTLGPIQPDAIMGIAEWIESL